MPPRFAYWTIILDGVPTSFRAREQAEILPLFNQLKKKNPGALLKWFSGGKLWDSPEQAREERQREHERQFQEQKNLRGRGASAPRSDRAPWKGGDRPMGPRADRPEGPPPDRAPRAEHPKEPRRSKDWRPGGEHKDPRDKYKLPPGEARKRWKQRHLGPPSTSLPSTTLRPGRPGRPFGGKSEGPPRSPGFKPAGPHPFTRRPPGGPGRNRPK